jgi:hypothetical protein
MTLQLLQKYVGDSTRFLVEYDGNIIDTFIPKGTDPFYKEDVAIDVHGEEYNVDSRFLSSVLVYSITHLPITLENILMASKEEIKNGPATVICFYENGNVMEDIEELVLERGAMKIDKIVKLTKVKL